MLSIQKNEYMLSLRNSEDCLTTLPAVLKVDTFREGGFPGFLPNSLVEVINHPYPGWITNQSRQL